MAKKESKQAQVPTQPAATPTQDYAADSVPAEAPEAPEVQEESSNLPALGNDFIHERQLTPDQIKQATSILAKVTKYTGAASRKADEYLGETVTIIGAITQPVNVGVKNPDNTPKTVIDPETGEDVQLFVPATRTILLMESGEAISMVSKAAEQFFNTFVFPLYGKGDFPAPLRLKITQVSKGDRRTFNFRIID